MCDGGAKIDGYVIEYLEVKPPRKPKPAEGEAPAAPEGEAEAKDQAEGAPAEGEAAPAPEPAPEAAPSASEPEAEEEEEDEDGKPKELPWMAYTTVKTLSINVSGLKLGKFYRFRVAARNIMGCSLPTETREAYEVKELKSKFSWFFALNTCDIKCMLYLEN